MREGSSDGVTESQVATGPTEDQDADLKARTERGQRVGKAVKTWTGQLVDLGGRNNLLYYKDLRRGTLDIAAAKPAARDNLLAGKKVRLTQLFGEEEREDAVRRARTIRNKSQEGFEERGLLTLYLACGLASWQNPKSGAVPASPVLLCPLHLAPRGGAQDDFDLSLTSELEVNPTLLHLLKTQFKCECDPQELLGMVDIEGPIDTPEELDTAYTWLREKAVGVPDFSITERLIIGNFSYAKLPMVNDLEAAVEILAEHELIAAIAGDSGAREAIRERQGEVKASDPNFTPPADEFLVLDADASQNYAINAVLGGQDLIIKGPPGTGKSQTISNLISTLLARGKTVLFVAEKRAAIDAVLGRLEHVGLDDLVLDLHGGTGSKRKTAQDIARTLSKNSATPPVERPVAHANLEKRRGELLEVADAVHRQREPWELSVYEAQAELHGVPEAGQTEVRFRGEDLQRLDAATYRQASEDLKEYVELGALSLNETVSPWARARVTSRDEARSTYELVARLAQHTLPSALQLLDAAAEETGLHAPATVASWPPMLDLWSEIGAILQQPNPSALELLDTAAREAGVPSPRTVAGWAALLDLWDDIDATLRRFEKSLYEEDLDRLCSDLAPATEGSLKRAGAVLTDADYRTARRLMKTIVRPEQRLSPPGVHNACVAARDQVARLEAAGGSKSSVALPGNRERLRPAYEQLLKELERLGTVVQTPELAEREVDSLAALLQPLLSGEEALAKLPQLFALWRSFEAAGLKPLVAEFRVVTAPTELERLRPAYKQLTQELQQLSTVLNAGELAERETDSLPALLQRLLGDQETLNKLPQLFALWGSLDRAGLKPLVTELHQRQLAPDLSVAALKYAWLQSFIEHVGFDDPLVGAFDGQRHTARVEEFREWDVEHIETTPGRVRRRCAEYATKVLDEFPDEAAVIQHQAHLKRRHLPLRQLFESTPNVLTAVKPCWAMSPLVVSQTLPATPCFDVVVFDEASQITPAEAIPAIARGKQTVVAGDERQLPPTAFFASATQESDEEEDTPPLAATEGFESILDALSALVSFRMLQWHYRSHDERLIAFSNVNLYDRGLTTFPGVTGEECLEHVLVPFELGHVGQEQSVSAEVEEVVRRIITHAEERPDETLGVIAMGIKHANRIDEALRAALTERPDLDEFFDETRDERFFVKNLERVQGDERDAIMLSVGYGKNPEGKMLYRFGPINNEGGERRLNVAVTRAKRRMALISSFDASDVDPSRTTSQGADLLRLYLQYAESRGSNLGNAVIDKPQLNPFEVDVRDSLTRAGIPLVAQYGCSGFWIDYAAKHPTKSGQMVLAIECDGASYHSSPTARDRDRLRQDQLERLGWTFHRIWSSDWFRHKGRETERAVKAYETAVRRADERAERGEKTPAAEKPAPRAAAPAGTPLRSPRPNVPPHYSIDDYRQSQLMSMVRHVESDGLLRTEEQLLDEVRRELGFERRGKKIVARIAAAITAVRNGGS